MMCSTSLLHIIIQNSMQPLHVLAKVEIVVGMS